MKRKRRKKRKKWPVVLVVILLILAAGAVGTYTFGMSLLNKVNTVDFPKDNESLGISNYVEEYHKDSDIRNIAIFGVDARDQVDGTRADTIIVCSLNKKTGEITLSSVFRDIYAKMSDEEKYGYDKINAAYSFGGPQMAVATLNQNYDLDIRDFIMVDFSAVANIVNAMDGITLTVKEDEVYQVNKYLHENNKVLGGEPEPDIQAGKQVLMGKQALSYCRIRYVGNGDFDRTARQRLVLNQIYKELKSEGKVTQLVDVLNAALPSITTSMNGNGMLPIFMTYLKSSGPPKTQAIAESRDLRAVNRNGVYYIIPFSLKDLVSHFHDKLYGDSNYAPSPVVEEISQHILDKMAYNAKYELDASSTIEP